MLVSELSQTRTEPNQLVCVQFQNAFWGQFSGGLHANPPSPSPEKEGRPGRLVEHDPTQLLGSIPRWDDRMLRM